MSSSKLLIAVLCSSRVLRPSSIGGGAGSSASTKAALASRSALIALSLSMYAVFSSGVAVPGGVSGISNGLLLLITGVCPSKRRPRLVGVVNAPETTSAPTAMGSKVSPPVTAR